MRSAPNNSPASRRTHLKTTESATRLGHVGGPSDRHGSVQRKQRKQSRRQPWARVELKLTALLWPRPARLRQKLRVWTASSGQRHGRRVEQKGAHGGWRSSTQKSNDTSGPPRAMPFLQAANQSLVPWPLRRCSSWLGARRQVNQRCRFDELKIAAFVSCSTAARAALF